MDGLEDKRNLEKAKLFIDEFDVPMVRDGLVEDISYLSVAYLVFH